ncbi:putative cullin 4B [Trypanosoma rangeli]|uniref:Putative cullin 4B n=1 Tax=Trypanosoma rangeli TaxID=5698 RepID=A0A422P208_TRYRA|nr:putative cullin 4B [Trypanosoma rangeli]RNF11750.1 putative cullin 4B [Trypanosoma rangeli]|eukprot:RNF11750.1 putative cullin 4B [Trypanosoma rangeli]
MTSHTLYDSPALGVRWDEGIMHVKPRMTVKLLTQDPAMHQLACKTAKEKAWAAAEAMLDAVLVRAAAHSEAVISSTLPFEHPTPLPSFLLPSSLPSSSTTLSVSSLRSRIPPMNVANRGYSADAACRSVQTLVELDAGAAVYEKLKHSLEAYVMHVLHLLTTACGADLAGSLTFMRLAHVWFHYRLAVAELQEVWVYLDRWYLAKVHAVRSIDGLAVAIMKEALLQHPWLLSQAQLGFLAALRQELEHDSNARGGMQLFTNLCSSIEVYFLRVEPDVLAAAKEFYNAVAERMWHNGDSAEVFFHQVRCFLQEGRQRVQACLEVHTMPRLEEIAQTSLLLAHGVDVLTRDFERLVREEKYDCIRLAWKFLASGMYVQLGKRCGAIFRHYILQEGAKIMRQLTTRTAEQEAFAAVKAMIALIRRGERVIETCFAENPTLFMVRMNDALTEVVQEKQTEFARQIARYLDWMMREGESDVLLAAAGSTASSGAPGDDSSPRTDVVTTTITTTTTGDASTGVPPCGEVLAYIGRIYALFPSRDIFEAFYWRDLARRLLQYHHPPRLSIERSFMQELKKTCGEETSKFEGMLNDFNVSQELSERYQAWVEGNCGAPPSPWSPELQVDNEAEEEKERRRWRQHRQSSGVREAVMMAEEVEAEETSMPTAAALRCTEVRLHILTSGFWPTESALEVLLPSPLQALAGRVQEFYSHCFADRKLVWQHQMSSAVVTCSTGAVRRQLTGTLLQAAMLLTLQEMMRTTPSTALSQVETVTVGALCERLAVDLSLPSVTGALYGLCHPKFPLLLRETAAVDTAAAAAAAASSTLAEADRLRFNPCFAFSAARCRIPFCRNPQGGEDAAVDRTDTDGMQAATDVLKEHAYVIEAAVVSFMKERRCLSHEELVAALPTLVRFPVTVATVKSIIERLINRGFLERSGAKAYVYAL